MAKYKFTLEQKYAVYKILGPLCVWCKEPVKYNECELDHIIPESSEKTEVDRIITLFKLSDKFSINSFYNWAPIHSKCNKGKSAKTFKNAPFIAEILHHIDTRVVEIEKLHEKAKQSFSDPIEAAKLENALKKNLISRDDIENLLKKSAKPLKLQGRFFNCKPIEFNEEGTYGKKTPKQIYKISYEQLDSEVKSLTEINCLVKSEAIKELINARENYYDNLKDLTTDDVCSDGYHEYSMRFSHLTKKILSYTSTVRFYHPGAAHDQYGITGNTYHLNPVRPFNLSSILTDYNSFIAKITPLAYDKIINEIRTFETELDVTDYSPIEKEWLTTEFNAFKNYHFTESALVFIFNPYEISAWAYGAHFPEFSFEEIISIFPEEIELIKFIKSIKIPARKKFPTKLKSTKVS